MIPRLAVIALVSVLTTTGFCADEPPLPSPATNETALSDTTTTNTADTTAIAITNAAPALADLPPPITAERYEALWKRSPFTLPTAETNAALEAPAKLALLGISRIGDDTYISILNKDTQVAQFISAREPGPYTIESIDMAERVSDSSVTLRQGAEVIVVKPDAALMAIPSAGVAPPQPVAATGNVPPALPLPTPAGNPAFQPPGAIPGAPPATAPRRRRVIVPPPPQ